MDSDEKGLLDELLSGENDKAPTTFVVPDDPSVPEEFRGKPFSAIMAEVEKSRAEKAQLAQALETVRTAQEKASAPPPEPTTPPAQQETKQAPVMDVSILLGELVAQRADKIVGNDQTLAPYRDEIEGLLNALRPEDRLKAEAMTQVIAYVRGQHFDEIMKARSAPTAVVDSVGGTRHAPPVNRPVSGVKVSDTQIAVLRSYHGDDDASIKDILTIRGGGDV